MRLIKNVPETFSLNGEWFFELDPNNHMQAGSFGVRDLPDRITVPGSWEEQGFGKPSDHSPIGTWKKHQEYVGSAWYGHEFLIPPTCEGKRFRLTISGAHWVTKVWINGSYVGEGESLVTPHIFDVTPFMRVGEEHSIVICVDNRMKYPLSESHIHSYHTATNWGGITGGITVEALSETFIDGVFVWPDALHRLLRMDVHLAGVEDGQSDRQLSVLAEVRDADGKLVGSHSSSMNSADPAEQVSITFDLGEEARLWSDRDPNLYSVSVDLSNPDGVLDRREVRCGLRTIQAQDGQIVLNGSAIFLRGYVDCCVFPLTGYPVWDVEHYRRQFRIVKQYGFNHVRLHSWTAPEPFWQAADEEGMIVQTELPQWSFFYRQRGVSPNMEAHQFLTREMERVIRGLNQHPSFAMLSMGNELIIEDGHDDLNLLVHLARELDPTRLYTDNTGFGQLPVLDREGDYYVPTLNWHPPHIFDYAATPNTQEDYHSVTQLETKPLIAHEHGQFTMYVRPAEAKKYTGVLFPAWLQTINESLQSKGWSQRVEEFQRASGSLLIRSLKEVMERARRTPGLSGIQLLDIRDFPGQGHATVGILDVFWDSKGLIEPQQFQIFNDDVVLLMKSPERTLFAGDSIDVSIGISNFGGQAISSGSLEWELRADQRVLERGTIHTSPVSVGTVKTIANIVVPTPANEPLALQLAVQLDTGVKVISNGWDLWSFQRPLRDSSTKGIWTNSAALKSVLHEAVFGQRLGLDFASYPEQQGFDLAITAQMSTDILQFLLDGGKVWYMATEGMQQDEVVTRYLPIFWNFLWPPNRVGETMGMIVKHHPALGRFPHDGTSNWQWYHIVDHSVALGLDLLPQIDPIVEVVDNFNRMKRLAYAFETRVGKGRLYVSTFRLNEVNNLKRPESQFLMWEIIRYLMSDQFTPSAQVTVSELLGLIKMKR